ncbi:solute carrier family 28 member 3-like [Mizuhopecten yessoensis]|uniref:Solute carrier family 28 member 3 n=1 Tax=Mizuhopecten yessoensis TaxID=6573 RepID=A0A210QYB3_MIZYE|nr:solute carrier family 28 member 3-like [Mizuhopecten yessoensis]XP_021346670.1 solute carrier family 28 member 3-like [Mizuhopecten yessoensis]XP_021346671.1 solute carrier family 28 member 3-like [Mizuhopecten yessoensis]OWF53706.1 Solute carrier family 28 member 3 [Mizuhopecten yessoensis]
MDTHKNSISRTVSRDTISDGSEEPLVSQLLTNGKASVVVDVDVLPEKKRSSEREPTLITDTFGQLLDYCSDTLDSCRSATQRWFNDAIFIALVVAYIIYIAFIIVFDTSTAFWTCVDLVLVFLAVVHRFWGIATLLSHVTTPLLEIRRRHCFFSQKRRTLAGKLFTALLFVAIGVYLVLDLYEEPERLIPLGGLLLFLVIMFVTSKAPSKVQWRAVLWGLLLQFLMGIVILRWPPGYRVCKMMGDAVAKFLSFTDYGSKFVFGDKNYTMHVVAFKILPVVVYFSAVVSILYYWGVMQIVIKGLAKLFQYTMKTTAVESFATAAHIFIGQVVSTVALKPFLRDLTLSELNAVMTSGFATVAGTVIAAYIEFGVPAEHVITASFMSAPAALAVSKLNWPETEVPQGDEKDIYVKLNVGNEHNVMEAASAGALTAIKLISYVTVNLIAFISLLAFLDYFLSFMGSRVGHPEVTFQFLCSYTFMPLALVMGVRWQDCGKVAELIGKKIFINEFLSFADLGTMIKNDEINERSVVIATYILCGFGSIAAMGINLGAFTAADPSRQKDYAKGMLRAMIGGNVACFMTACVAGILYQGNPLQNLNLNVTTTVNSTFVNGSSLGTSIPMFNGSFLSNSSSVFTNSTLGNMLNGTL